MVVSAGRVVSLAVYWDRAKALAAEAGDAELNAFSARWT